MGMFKDSVIFDSVESFLFVKKSNIFLQLSLPII